MLIDISSKGSQFPKTVLIRNEQGGMIWQIYHVDNLKQAEILADNATMNGFECVTLNDKTDHEESFPDWKGTKGGKKLIVDSLK